MAWTSPKTWVPLEVVTASMLNTQLRDNLAYLKDSPTFDGDVVISGSLTVDGASITASPRVSQGRLTLTTAVPVTTADVTAATSIFWTPYQGNLISLYSGTEWVQFTQAQLTIAVPATTATMYDVFVDYNGGTPILSLTAWTNVTTRATALTTQDGVLVLTGSTGKRYVGSFCTTGVSGQTEDSRANRLLYNYYNRVPRPLELFEVTNSWTYTTNTWRQARATATNQVAVVNGVAESPVEIGLGVVVQNSSGTAAVGLGIGLDSTTAPASNQNVGSIQIFGVSELVHLKATYRGTPAVGYHTFVWLERAEAVGTTTWYSALMPWGFGGPSGLQGVVVQ